MLASGFRASPARLPLQVQQSNVILESVHYGCFFSTGTNVILEACVVVLYLPFSFIV
jgi:hypothetical protein